MAEIARRAADALLAHSDSIVPELLAALPLGRPGPELAGDLTYLLAGFAAATELRSTGLVDWHLEWQKVRTAALGGQPECVAALPAAVLAAVQGRMPAAEADAVAQVLRFAGVYVRHVPNAGRAGWGLAAGDDRLGEPAARFLRAAFAGDRVLARAEVLGAGSPADAVQTVLEPALREVGRRWMVGALGVRDEHLASALVHELMHQLLAGMPAPAAGAILVAVVRSDADEHSIGQKLPEVHLRSAGLRTRTLVAGAGTRAVEALAALRPDALAISCATLPHLRATADLIAAVRASPMLAGIPVLVGGRMFVEVPQLATQLGADCGGVDGRLAAELIRSLIPV